MTHGAPRFRAALNPRSHRGRDQRPRPRRADLRRTARSNRAHRRDAQRLRSRPRGPDRDRPAQRPRDGHRVSRRRLGRHRRAAQPGLPPGGVRLLPLRPRSARRPRAARRLIARPRRRREARHPDHRADPSTDRPAGEFTLEADISGAAERPGTAEADDVALVLHTSGTTARPKIVPLRQRNVCASAAHIRETLSLTPDDRCLNIMPLFHIHGLIAGVLASVGAGGCTWCSPGFNAMQVFGWLQDAQPPVHRRPDDAPADSHPRRSQRRRFSPTPSCG